MTEITRKLELYRLIKEKPYLVVDFPSEKHLEFVKSDKPFKLLLGGNRSGKTETAAIEVIWHLLGEHPFITTAEPPVRWRIHVPDYHQIDVILDKMKRYLPENLIKGGWDGYNKRTHTLRLVNDSVVDFTTHRTSDRALEGASLDGVWIDEECSAKQYRSLLYRTIDRSGKVFITATPIHGITWLYEEVVRRWEEGDQHYHVTMVSTYENKYLSPDDILRIEQSASEEEKEIRLFGRIMNYTRRFINAFDPRTHVSRFPFPPPSCAFYAGLDWGYHHPTAIVYIAKHNDFYQVLGVEKRRFMQLEAAGRLIEDFYLVNGVNPRKVVVVYDAALNQITPNGKREIDVLKTFPFRLKPSAKNTNLTAAVVNSLFNENRVVIHTDCQELINDLSNLYVYNGKVREDDPAKDTVDALRYALFYAESMDTRFSAEDEEPTEGEPLPINVKMREALMRNRRGSFKPFYGVMRDER